MARTMDDNDTSKRKRAMGLGKRLWTQVNEDHVGLIAAGVAFYGLLALFPAITALMAIAGLLVQPSEVVDQLQRFSDIVPEEVLSIIVGQASAIAGSHGGGLGLAALLGIGFAIWSASRGMASLIEGMNVAYGEKETRGFIKLKAVTLALTLLVVFGVIFGMLATMAVPAVLSFVQLGVFGSVISFALVWGLLLAFTFGGLTIIYRTARTIPIPAPTAGGLRARRWPACCGSWPRAASPFMSGISVPTTKVSGRCRG